VHQQESLIAHVVCVGAWVRVACGRDRRARRYHGALEKVDAERLLSSAAPGSFLVRDSRQRGCVAVSIKLADSTSPFSHILIAPCDPSGQQNGVDAIADPRYMIGVSDKRVYRSVPAIVEAYMQIDPPVLSTPLHRLCR
jgi:hypothetical protein